MAPILDIEVECGEQKSRLLRGMVVLRGTVNYCRLHAAQGSRGEVALMNRYKISANGQFGDEIP